MNNIERDLGDTDGFGPKPDAAERRRLIQWRLDWLDDEIVIAWGEDDECIDWLMEERGSWEAALYDPENTDVPYLDAKGRPIGYEEDNPCGPGELDGPDFDQLKWNN